MLPNAVNTVKRHARRRRRWRLAREMVCLAGVRQAGLMVIEVTRIGGDGSISRAVVDTAGRDDAARWEQLAQQATLEVPPPYRPQPGQPVYEVSVGGHAAHVAEKDLAGPLRELVSAVLATVNLVDRRDVLS